jgi:xylulokinase
MLLGIDLGTSSVKVLLLDTDGTVLGEASHSYPVRALQPGWSETDPDAWWLAVIAAVRKAVGSRAREIRAIGLAGQMHGVVLTDSQGQALRPAVLWADTRAHGELQRYRDLPVSNRQALANPITVGMAGPTLLWLKKNEAEIYGKARWALQPKDWLRLRLTEEVATDPSDASATLLYDVQQDQWAQGIIKVLGIRQDLLPPILSSIQVAGHLCASAASALGIPQDMPVAVGAADAAAAALGSGLIREGDAQLTVGSGAQIVSITTSPKAAPEFGLHLYRAVNPDTFYTMAAMQNAGLALEWVRSILGLTWDDVYELATTVEPGCNGLSFLPYLTGERTPHLNSDACGLWFGLKRHHTRAHLIRAALEGVAFAIRDGLQAFKKVGVHPRTLRIAGGGTQQAFWRQLLADTLQEMLGVSSVTNASARGAAFLAALATGTAIHELPVPALAEPVNPNPPHPNLEQAYLKFQELYSRLFT